jgi:LytR cell envelope-related transcriptional attenuator
VDVPAASPQELARPWRTATFVATGVAAVELVLLLVAGTFLVAKPLSRTVRHHAEVAALAPPKKTAKPGAKRTTASAAVPKLTRAQTSVIVLNGNGRSGAAAQGAARLHAFGYVIAGTANARRQDYAATVVMYRPGYRAEGLRLAHDLKVKVVGPLDGLKPSALMGGQLAVVIGA